MDGNSVNDGGATTILEAMSSGQGELRISNVKLKIVGESLSVSQEFTQELELSVSSHGPACRACFNDDTVQVFEVEVTSLGGVYQAGPTEILLRVPQGSALVTTHTQNDTSQLFKYLQSHATGNTNRKESMFSQRTDESSSKQFFQVYGCLLQQQNMLRDFERTSTYQSAMLQNVQDFKDKVVMDVGAGSGILSFFAVQAGAKKVYAIEGSNMAVHCTKLVSGNELSNKITVVAGKVEEVNIPEQVDMIVSEPMGYMLFNERVIESYLHAKKWLKPGGKMFPSKGVLYIAPFSDEALYIEQYSKFTFWTQTSFHGVNLTPLAAEAKEECFKQPIKDIFDDQILMAKPVAHTTDFLTTHEVDLHKIVIPLSYTLLSTGMMHGLAFWFDVAFCGSQETVWLSTAPTRPPTHWHQIRCLLPEPILVSSGQMLTGIVTLIANHRQSYDVEIEIGIQGTDIQQSSSYDLKTPKQRYMTTPPARVPGTQHTNPTESDFDSTSKRQQQLVGQGSSGGVYAHPPQSLHGVNFQLGQI